MLGRNPVRGSDGFITASDLINTEHGSIKYAENPPKKYQDVFPVNFDTADREGLWQALLDLFWFWIEHGVKIFRVDNPHTKPIGFWEWAIGEVRAKHPEVIFLAEAFTRPKKCLQAWSGLRAARSEGGFFFFFLQPPRGHSTNRSAIQGTNWFSDMQLRLSESTAPHNPGSPGGCLC